MKRNLVEAYALAVCAVMLFFFLAALGQAIYDIVRIANPEFTIASWNYDRHQSNDAFSKILPKDKSLPPVEELTKMRERSYQDQLRSEKRNGVQSLTRQLIWLLITIVVFAIHWFMAKRVRSMPITG
ncbi:MAG: hypothetical protein ACLQPD_18650 [Desulfomonilaceae bacterium]